MKLLFTSLFIALAFSAPTEPVATLNDSTGTSSFARINSTDATANDIKITYKCETTIGSPKVTNIRYVIDKLNARGDKRCIQSNGRGSYCKTLGSAFDAAIAICGHPGGELLCRDVANGGKVIADNCAWNGLAGGQVWYSHEKDERVIVYHSD